MSYPSIINIARYALELYKSNYKIYINLVSRVIGLIVSFIYSYLLVKEIGADDVGFYQMALSIVAIYAVWIGNGSENYLLKNLAINKPRKVKLHYILISLFFSLLVAFFTYGVVSLLWPYFWNGNYPLQKSDVSVISFIAFCYYLSLTLSNVLQTYGKANLSTFIVSTLLPTINVFILLILQMKSFRDILIYLSFSYVICITMLIFNVGYSYINDIKSPKRIYFKISFLSYIKGVYQRVAFLTNSLLGIVFSHAPILIVGYYLEPSNVAYFAYSIRIASLVSFPLSAVNSHLAHKISMLFSEKKTKELKRVYYNGIKSMVMVSIFPALIVFIFSKEIMAFFGQNFAEHSYLVIIIMCGEIINILCGSTGVTLGMTGYHKVNLYLNIFYGVFLIIILPLAINVFGLIGAAYIYALRLALWNISGLYLVNKLVFINKCK